MSQATDYTIDNSTGANVRSDINTVLGAIATNNSGGSDNGSIQALGFFANTSTSKLQLKNAAGNAFINLRGFDGSLPLPDGSASSPSLFFDDDTNTGVFSSAADTFEIATGGTQRFQITSNGTINFNANARIQNDGILRSADGDASRPAYNFLSDNDNGMFRATTNTIGFSTAGSERLRINSSGRVLIGTSTASSAGNSQYSLFEVSGNTSASTGVAHLTLKKGQTSANLSDGDSLGRLIFSSLDGGDFAFIQVSVDGSPSGSDFPGSMRFHTCADGASSSTERMRIDSSGNVLIGTTTKGANGADELTIGTSGDTGMTIRSGSSSAGNIFFSDGTSGADETRGILRYFHNTNAMVFNTDNAERMRIDSSGRVGIGITSPDQKLVVADTSSVSLIRVTANNAQEAGIDFGDTDDNDIGRIRYDNSVNAMRFFVNAAERMRIDSSGRFGLGVSSLGSAFIEARQNSPVAGRLLALGSNGTSTTDTAGGLSNALVLFRNRKEVLPNQTTDLVSGYGGSLVLITILNSSGDNVQQTRVRSHAWNSSIQLFSNSYGAVSPTITFSTASGVLKVNHSSNGNLIFNCAGFIISAPHTG